MSRLSYIVFVSALSVGVTSSFVADAVGVTKKKQAHEAVERTELPDTSAFPPIVQPVTATECLKADIPNKPYFVEFRARSAQSYGHTFVLHGLLGSNGFRKVSIAGLHPKGDDPVVYTMGHLVPVPAETGQSWGDMDEQYLQARYCIRLDANEYQRVAAYISHLQATKKTWLATGYNCNSFAGDIARFLGLRAPGSSMLNVPEQYINSIRSLNNGRQEAVSTSDAILGDEALQQSSSMQGPQN